MPTDLIRYDLLVQDALRSVVRQVLSDAARNGLPGDHHFNISFKTGAPGVGLPPAMRQRYPDEMTIILQHEFWDLIVEADAFEVGLNFSRKPERLRIPFDAIVAFNDPSVPFGFKLEPREAPPSAEKTEERPSRPEAAPEPSSKPQPAPLPAPAKTAPAAVSAARPKGAAESQPKTAESAAAPGKVVSIDAFRKK
jgi:uncharacterized protein